LKKHMLDTEAIAKYGRFRSQWARKERAAMETAGIAPLGYFSKFFDLKEDAWESALAAAIPGKFSKLNKNTYHLRKIS